MIHIAKNVEFEKQIEKMLDSLSQQSSDSMWFLLINGERNQETIGPEFATYICRYRYKYSV